MNVNQINRFKPELCLVFNFKVKELITLIEEWKDVVGLEEYAQISNFGRVKTKDRYINNNGTLVLKSSKFLTGTNNGLGYLQCRIVVNGKTYRKYIHRMVAEAFLDNQNNLPDVNHIDGDKSNNNLSNLEWSSRSDNIKHAIKNGLLIHNGKFSKSMDV